MAENAPTRSAPKARRLALAFVVVLVAAGVVWFALSGESSSSHFDPSATIAAGPSSEIEAAGPLASPSPVDHARIASTVEATGSGLDASLEAVIAARLTVEIVDARGQALEGVQVTGLVLESDDTFAQAITDAGGRAQFEFEASDIPRAKRVRFGTPFLPTTPIGLEFDTQDWPADSVRLVAGPSGAIELSFEAAASYPMNRHAHMWLSFGEERCGLEIAQGLHEKHMGFELDAHTQRIAHVGLGLCFDLGSYTPGLEFDDVEFDGPASEGQLVRVDVPLERVEVRIVGRVVDPEGSALPEHRVSLDMNRASGSTALVPRTLEADTDGAGRLEGFVPAHDVERTISPLGIRAEGAGQLVRWGTAAWPGSGSTTLVRGYPTIDLGDLVVASEPRIASGRVIDVTAEPLSPWAYVSIQIRSLDPDSSTRWSNTFARVARDGTFQLGSRYAEKRFELRASAYDRTPSEPVAVDRGAEGVELRLRAGAKVEGRLIVAEGIDPDLLDLEFECVAPADSPEHRVSGWDTFDDGRFRLRSLLPGRYELVVTYLDVELARVTFEPTSDGSTLVMEPNDLRDRVHAIKLRIVGLDGSEISTGSVNLLREEESLQSSTLDRNGRATLCGLTRVVDVVAAAPGFRTQRFDNVTSGADLALEPGLAVRIHVPNLPPAPAGWTYEVALEPEKGVLLAESSEIVRARLDARGFATLRAPYAGGFGVSATIVDVGARSTIYLAVLDGFRIEPQPDGAMPALTLEADPADVRDAIEQTRSR